MVAVSRGPFEWYEEEKGAGLGVESTLLNSTLFGLSWPGDAYLIRSEADPILVARCTSARNKNW